MVKSSKDEVLVKWRIKVGIIMDYMTTAYSDVGIKKATNQDSLLVQIADTELGKIAFSVLCDGMGGLAKGELASATLIRRFSDWFIHEFPDMLYGGMDGLSIKSAWESIVMEMNGKIGEYSACNHLTMGTTVIALLVVGNSYYVINVGDSRVYLLTDNIYQITKDQTFVQREIDMGRMTYEQAQVDTRRNVLLQCVGASANIEPDFYSGTVAPNSLFLLCSDGFRHVIAPEEIYGVLNPFGLSSEEEMYNNAKYLVDLNKSRMEEDNISVVLVKSI